MTKAELKLALVHFNNMVEARQGRPIERHWIGSTVTDTIVGSDKPTHRNWFIWHPQAAN